MPSRVIRSSINRSKSLSRVSLGANLLFRALLNECDDYGRMEAEPAVLRGTVFPLLVEQISVEEVTAWLDELAHADDPERHNGIEPDVSPIGLYTIGRTQYLFFTRWEDHRGKSKRGGHSKFPAPPSPPDPKAPGASPEVHGDPRESTGTPGPPPEESRSRGVEEKKGEAAARPARASGSSTSGRKPCRQCGEAHGSKGRPFPEKLSETEAAALKRWCEQRRVPLEKARRYAIRAREWYDEHPAKRARACWVAFIRKALLEEWWEGKQSTSPRSRGRYQAAPGPFNSELPQMKGNRSGPKDDMAPVASVVRDLFPGAATGGS